MSQSPHHGSAMDAPATVLIVDDARINRELLRLNLTRHGYEFLMARNGREAVEMLQDHTEVDLILLDLMMPEMDGFDFLRWRSRDQRAQAVPVIVNSALDDFDSISRALAMDAYDYFTKPLSQRDLETILPVKIKNAVTNRRLVAETRRQNELMSRELELAARYQHFLLPKDLQVSWGRVEFLFEPCTGVGGDYYDILDLKEGHAGILVADVSGHGVASAMTTSIVKALLPGYLQTLLSPARALKALNDDLLRLTPVDAFVSAFALLYDPRQRRLTWSCAGHPPGLLLPSGGPLRQLSQDSMFLGVFASDHELIDYQDRDLQVGEGDRLVVYTDGIIEAASSTGQAFGADRLQALVQEGAGEELPALRDRLWRELNDFVPGDMADDVAVVLVEFCHER